MLGEFVEHLLSLTHSTTGGGGVYLRPGFLPFIDDCFREANSLTEVSVCVVCCMHVCMYVCVCAALL